MSDSRNMVEQIEEYLAFRRRLGYALVADGKELMLFARYADKTGHQGPVTTSLATQWARLPKGAHPSYWARRLHAVRQFARYASLYDETTEIPPADTFGSMKRRRMPHIYSSEQITDLLQAASRLEPRDGLRPRTYFTLFGLLLSTGLRISEALVLTLETVDLENGVLLIQQTKFRKDRLVPVYPSTLQRLRRYHCATEDYRAKSQVGAFFLEENGRPLNYRGVLYRFMQLRKELGWGTSPAGRRPRLHDIRHTFAVQRLLQWYREGHSIDEYILYLSAYLGHSCVSDTYWYLTAVPELMELASERFHKFVHKQGGK
jgi:integrase